MKSNSLSVSRTGDVGQFFDTVLLHYSRQVLYYFLARIGIDKVCRTHAHRFQPARHRQRPVFKRVLHGSGAEPADLWAEILPPRLCRHHFVV